MTTGKKILYFLIKDTGSGEYWLEGGGVDPRQCKAERHPTRKVAREERDTWVHPASPAHLVRVVARS
jgi:hypothetical protein